MKRSTQNSSRRHRNGAPKPGAIRPRSPEVIAGLYSGVERMRLWSSSKVIRKAELVILHVIDAYASPDRTFDELRQNMDAAISSDPIKAFSEACRLELQALLR